MFRRPISYLALVAVGLCVFIVFVVMTVMSGLVGDFRDKNHSYAGDCVLHSQSLVGFCYYEDFIELLEKQDFIRAVSPVIKSYALVSSEGSQRSYGLEMLGIEPARHSKATGFGQSLHYHKSDASQAFSPVYEPKLPGFVIGIDKWVKRDGRGSYPHPDRPGRASLAISCFPLTPRGALARAGTDMVNTKTFYFSDTTHSGIARIDSSVIYIPFEWAQKLCGMAAAADRVNEIRIGFKDGVEISQGCEKVERLWRRFKQGKQDKRFSYLMDKVQVSDWRSYRREFIAAMEKEQILLIIMFCLVAVTAVFVVFVVFYMIVSHKSKDIGILKSIGASNADVMKLFGCFAILTALVSSAVGIAGGWLFVFNINRIENWLFERFGFQLWDRTIYAIGEIPNKVEAEVVFLIAAAAAAACILGAFIPARQAARCEIVEALQVSQL